MIKRYKWTLLISSIVILLPMFFGLIMWDKLPETFTTHWNIAGEADGHGGRVMAVVVIPCIMLAVHWLCVLVTAADPNNKDHNAKMQRIVLWIIPVLSLLVCGMTYAFSAGIEFDMVTVITLMLGVMLAILGNYLPKCKQNSTMGIKLSWTLSNEENWNRTHRLAGRLWLIGGIIVMICAFLPLGAVAFIIPAVLILMIVIPVLYSYSIYRKMKKENGGVAPVSGTVDMEFMRKGSKIAWIVIPVILIGIAAIMFTGSIDVQYGDTSFTVDATYWEKVEIAYADIDSLELREDSAVGVKVNGFNSARLLLGWFENEEFGRYTRYTYTGDTGAVVIVIDGETVVIGGRDAAATQEIYDQLSAHVAE